MPYGAVSATLFMACGDSNHLLERLQPDGARAIRFFFWNSSFWPVVRLLIETIGSLTLAMKLRFCDVQF